MTDTTFSGFLEENEYSPERIGRLKEPIFLGDYSFNTGKIRQLSAVDYAVFIAVLVISLAVAFYHIWKEENAFSLDQFLLAGRSMGPLPVGMSLLGSFMSAITLLGLPAEMYNYTTMYWWIGLAYLLVIMVAAHIYLPMFYYLGVTSAFEYLEMRFSRGVRTVAAVIYYIQMLIYLSIVLFAPSLAVNAVTGFTLWGAVMSIGVISTMYTAMGGMRTVLWTDVFQSGLMLLSLGVTLIKASVVVGGMDVLWESAERTKRIWFTDFRLDPTVRHSFWGLVIGSFFTWTYVYSCNQVQIQRMCTCPTIAMAKIALYINLIGLWFILYVGCLIGLFMAAFYENCDPLKAKFVTASNELMPLFVMDIMGDFKGLPGFYLAGLFSAAISTISSGLNAVAATILEDMIKIYIINDMSDLRATRISQLLTVILGLAVMSLTVIAASLHDILEAALSIYGMIGGPLVGVFSLGLFFPWANYQGAYAGFSGSLLLMLWIGIGRLVEKPSETNALRFTDNCNRSAFNNATLEALDATPPPMVEPVRNALSTIYSISYMWYCMIAVFTCITIGLIVSFSTGAVKPESLDPRLICPLCDFVFPFNYLPERIREKLRFGINHVGKYDMKLTENVWKPTTERSEQEKTPPLVEREPAYKKASVTSVELPRGSLIDPASDVNRFEYTASEMPRGSNTTISEMERNSL